MSKDVRFSIICPVYNSRHTLLDSFNSIVNQSCNNWELMLVDDGSTDNSGIICDEFAKKDSRIKVIHKLNEGQSKARLDAIKISSGDFLLFLDSDDEYKSNALEIINNYLSINDNTDFLVFNALKENKNGSYNPIYVFDDSTIEQPFVECLCKRRVSYFWTICFRKKLIDRMNSDTLDTFVNLTYSEDFYLIYNLIKELDNNNFGIIDQKLYIYKYNENSITSRQNSKKAMDRFYAFNYVYEDFYINNLELFKAIDKNEVSTAGWIYFSAAKRSAIECDKNTYKNRIKKIRKSFLFKQMSNYKRDKFSQIGYILLKLKMYGLFRKYIIKNEGK